MSTLAIEPLPQMIARFGARHPSILVNVMDPGNPAAAVSQVRRGQVEIGVTALQVKSDTLATRERWAQEIVIALPPSLAAGLPDPIPHDATPAIPLVVEFSDNGGRSLIDERLDRPIGIVAVECAASGWAARPGSVEVAVTTPGGVVKADGVVVACDVRSIRILLNGGVCGVPAARLLSGAGDAAVVTGPVGFAELFTEQFADDALG